MILVASASPETGCSMALVASAIPETGFASAIPETGFSMALVASASPRNLIFDGFGGLRQPPMGAGTRNCIAQASATPKTW